MKYGKLQVNIALSEFGELKSLKNSLFNEIRPKSSPKSIKLIPTIFSAFLAFIK